MIRKIYLLFIIIILFIFIGSGFFYIKYRDKNKPLPEVKNNNNLIETKNMLEYVNYTSQNHQAKTKLEIEVGIKNNDLIERKPEDDKKEISLKITTFSGDDLIIYEKKAELTPADWADLSQYIKTNTDNTPDTSASLLTPDSENIRSEESGHYTIYEAGRSLELKSDHDLGTYLLKLVKNKLNFYFSERLAKFQLNGLSGYMNDIYRIVIKPQYLEADDFINGQAKVTLTDGTKILINTLGEIIKN